MYLDAVNLKAERGIDGSPAAATAKGRSHCGANVEVYDRWREWPPSEISHHGEACCEVAREWLLSMDYSELCGAALTSGPRWLRNRYKWGASTFPIYWCDAVTRKTLDCGALAAFSHAIFCSRGVESFRVQMVQRYSEDSGRQWNESWNDTGEPLKWVSEDLIYHEGVAIVAPRAMPEQPQHGVVAQLSPTNGGHANGNGNGKKHADKNSEGKVVNFQQHRNGSSASTNGHAKANGASPVLDSRVAPCPVLAQNGETQIAVWDSSAGWWCDPCVTEGYGSIVALRVTTNNPEHTAFRWGRHLIKPGEWTAM